MKKFMGWLTDKFAPTMNKFIQKPWIAALSSTMQKVIPFIMTGSVVFLYNVFQSYLEFLPDLSGISNFSFGMLGLLIAFLMMNQVMEKLRLPRYTITGALTSICVFFIFIHPTIENGVFSVDFARFGPTGILVGLLAGIFTALIYSLYAKIPFLKDTSIPDFVVEWIHNIIPMFVSLGLASLISFRFNIDIFNIIEIVFSPLQNIAQTLPGLILICLIPAILYSIGISSWVFGAVSTPIFMVGIQANIDAVANGLPATNIVTSETVFTAALITMGGMGATLALNVIMLFSKSKRMKTMGKICIVPSLFNINEPLVFGTPIVMNPILMVPFWLCSIAGSIVVWISMSTGLLNIPSKMIQIGQIPAPISSVMITEDLRAIIVYIVLFAIYAAIWYPFFKVHEKTCIDEENAEAAEEAKKHLKATEA